MMYDESGEGPQHDIDDYDPRSVPRPAQLPSPEVQSEIVKLGRQPGWNAERVQRALHENRLDVPLNTIRYLMAER
jgi:hypothetical protein